MTERAPISVLPSHAAQVGGMDVRRALPRAGRRTVGAWCFVDHMGPASVVIGEGFDVGPHPHIGLQTVTWLLSGEALHRDSLGTEQPIRPGQLNLMTAGNGIAHAEEGMGSSTGRVHGVQLWVALPEASRHGAPAFEHHATLPEIDLRHGRATVLVGEFAGSRSPTRADTDHVGVDVLVQNGTIVVALNPAFEHAIVVTEGRVRLGAADGPTLQPGNLADLGTGRDELAITSDGPSRLMLIGGSPFESPISMWWNFVARTHDEIDQAVDEWNANSGRFADVASTLGRIPAPLTPWRAHSERLG